MKINVPQRYDNIALGTFVRYHALRSDVDRVMLITGASKKTVEAWQVSTIETIVNEYSTALEQGTPKMDYIINGEVDLAFIPDIDAITLREHIDLDSYAQAIWKGNNVIDYANLPNLMAILYRPIKHRFGKWYELEAYDVDRVKYYFDTINTMTMSQVNGAMVFFSTILNELVQNSLHFLEQERTKVMKELEAMT
jgi:hypothetical protein